MSEQDYGEGASDPAECGGCGGIFHVDEVACPGCGWQDPESIIDMDRLALDGPPADGEEK